MTGDASDRKQKTATPRMRLGVSGERLAAGWLETHGYTIIATNCIENGYTLLHNDRDFDAFERHLGLKVASVS